MDIKVNERQPFIFIVDDIDENLQVLGNILFNKDYEVSVANNGKEALEVMTWDELPDLILLDVMMPDIDGFEVCKKLKANSKTAHIPVIFLTAKAESESIVEGFKAGGVDYVTKPFQREELLIRIETHLELKFSREALLNKSRELESLNEKLQLSEKQLIEYNHELIKINDIKDQYLNQITSELEKAANYVRSIIPAELKNQSIEINWKFEPSDKLGGDIFGYHFLNPNKLAIYLIDVCGHGIDATLHAVSVINTIRYKMLSNTDFSKPDEVLNRLNEIYQLTDHNHLYFTAWYGVIDKENLTLTYCGAAHPPVIMFDSFDNIKHLESKYIMVGGMPETTYLSENIKLSKNDILYIYSDGAYEVITNDGKQLTYDHIAQYLKKTDRRSKTDLENLHNYVLNISQEKKLKDDFSIIKISLV